MNLKSRPAAFAGIVLASALTLTACGGEDTSGLEPKVRSTQGSTDGAESEPEAMPEEEAPAEGEEVSEDPEEPAGGNETGSGSYTSPEWAQEVAPVGDLVATMDGDWITVEVYRVAEGESTKDSMWLHADSEEPIMKKGDPVVALNYIATNTGSEEILMSNLFLGSSLRYEGGKYLQGAMSDSNDAWLEELNINPNPFTEYPSPAVFAVAPGESISYGEIYQLEKDTAQLSFDITPVTSDGELDFEGKFKERFETSFEMK